MPLDHDQLRQAAEAIAGARIAGHRIRLAPGLRPTTVAEGYAVQRAVTGLLEARAGLRVCGWKVGAPDAKTKPNASPILRVIRSPARMDPAKFGMIGVEAEIAIVFGADLPPRAAAYSAAEVRAAITQIVAAIEVCDARMEDWQDATDPLKLADHQLNVALVTGSGIAAAAAPDFTRQAMTMRVNGQIAKEGIGCHALGDPLALLPWIAGHAAGAGGLRSGDTVTTGAWLGMHFVEPGATVEVEFPGIGTAAATFAA